MTLPTPEQELACIAEQQKISVSSANPTDGWETPAHGEVDPFDPEYGMIHAEQGLIPFVKAAIAKGFHVFALRPKDKLPLPGSHGYKDSKQGTDPLVLEPWTNNPEFNIGIDLGASNLTVLDFDKPEAIPPWLNETKTYKVKSAKGVHFYFRGVRKTSKLRVNKKLVGDIKSEGGYVLAEGSVHPDGPIYTVIDSSEIADLPDISELVKQETEIRESVNASEDGPPIPYGSHDTELTRIAGLLRNAGFKPDEIAEHLIRVCERRCENHGTDYREMCGKIAKSIGQKPVGEASPRLDFDTAQTGRTGRALGFGRRGSTKPARLKWLWKNRILVDKLNVFSGEPDVGKSMVTIDLAARITRHLDFPDCKNELDGPRGVLFMSSEDDIEDTILPRLMAAGADISSKIYFAEITENANGEATEGIVCLDRDLPALEKMIKSNPDIVLIIVDPIIAFLGDVDPNKDKEVRPIYSKMKAFAKRTNVAWLFVNHWNKNQNASSINRTSGAKTMVSAPRTTWMFSKSPEDPSRYLMMKGKGNLSSLNGAKSLAYRIVGTPFDFEDGKPLGEVPKIVWDGETGHAVENVLQEQADPAKRRNSKAEELLTKLLESGPMKAKELYRAAEAEGLSSDQMKRARYKLRYVVVRIDDHWFWGRSEDEIHVLKLERHTRGKPAVDFDAPMLN